MEDSITERKLLGKIQIKIMEIKKISALDNPTDWLISRIETVDRGINEFEDDLIKSVEISQTKHEGESERVKKENPGNRDDCHVVEYRGR